ncbi:MAG: ABC transporter permease [Ignavibacteriaceae bacterium]
MIKNYLKTAIRSLIRNKSFTIINIIGLTIGIAACLLIFLLIRYELSYDTFHTHKDNIFRIVSESKSPDGIRHSDGVPLPLAEGLRLDFPELLKVASVLQVEAQITIPPGNNSNEKKFREESGAFYIEPEFFEIFDFPLLAGDKKTALSEPNTALLTQSVAEKYFGNWKSAIGKIIRHDNKYDYKVTGILKNIPVNSDFPLGVVISYVSLKNTDYSYNFDDWKSTFGNLNTYVIVPPGKTEASFNRSLKSFALNYKPVEYTRDGFISQPLDELHFDGRFGNFNGRTFSRELIMALSLIAAFLLIIACVNFINLATAQSVNRSREVGVRKVLGGNRRQLALQFMSETTLITIFAVISALIIAEIALPYLNEFLETSIRFNFWSSTDIMVFMLVITLFAILFSGFYPAMVLSGFNPITALKNKTVPKSFGGVSLRRALVIFQFIIGQTLVICMLVVTSQMDFFRNVSMGFDKDAVVLVPIPTDSISRAKIDVLKIQLLQQAGIKNVSFSIFSPSDNSHWRSDFKFDGSARPTDFSADLKWADVDYFKIYNLSLIAGNFYTQSDSIRGYVVNETLVKKLGIKNPGDVIGREIDFWNGQYVGPIVGVIKDFHEGSLHSNIQPVVLSTWREVYSLINIKIQPQQVKETLASIEKLWNNTYPEYVYEYQFLDEKVENFYIQEDQLSQLYKVFAAIAIFISCLGLYGLVSFMTVQRTKEVGIRKVLGATTTNILYLFSKEFIILIGLAFLAAAPLSYFIMQKWLEDFAYRIEIGFGLFFIAITASIGFALLTVSYRAVKAALANPVKSLKYE